ncbi:MAG: DUF2845 domain-containing protein [Aeromonadaceae bacterium]
MKRIMALGLCLALAGLQQVQAQSMRCGNNLVVVGDQTVTLLTKCGKPLLVEAISRTAQTEQGELTQVQAGERWTYDQGKGKFMQIVTIYNGVVKSIEDGPRN